MVGKKHILAIDFILVIGSLLLVAGFVGYSQPLVIAPIDGHTSTDGAVLFEFEKADLILIDDNLDFSSPQEIYVEDNLVINLKPGVYYWKVFGAFESDVREIKIESEIDLKLRGSDEDGRYKVVNSGNERLSVDVYDYGKFSGNVVLDVDESKDVSGTKFIGSQDEN